MTAMIAPSQARERAALRAGLDDFVATRLFFLEIQNTPMSASSPAPKDR
jgi:hypothetical protein